MYFFLFFAHTKFIMNQILSTKLEQNKRNSEKKNWFKFQFTFSIFIMVALVSSVFYYFYHLTKKEDFSNNLIANYNIYRLYSTSTKNTSNEESSNGLFRNY